MTLRSRTKQALAMLLPAGVLGISAMLATVQAEGSPVDRKSDERMSSVAERLSEIRAGVSEVEFKDRKNPHGEAAALLGEWPNFSGGFGWRNGGWGNGWHNGGWGNGGWHNWHNGGWGNGGGWHNWHNFWHNW